jgi:heme-degrading monooxygenase HmoA
MYLRFIHLHVREGQEGTFSRFYQERILPALAETEGCLYAALLAPWRSETYQSLTIWSSPEHAAAYEEGGLYHRLLAESAPMLANTSAWRVHLSRDPTATLDPSRREPPSEGYRIETPEGAAALASPADRPPFVRIVALRVAHDRLDEFLALYRSEVIPSLETVHGCRGVFLAERVHHPMETLSITLWDREEDAVRYEMSGEFERLTRRLQGTFSPVYDWRAGLGEPAAASRPEVTSYQLVRGRRLGPLDEDGR